MSEDRSQGKVVTLYEAWHGRPMLQASFEQVERSPLPDDWCGAEVISFPRGNDEAPRAGRFDFLRGAEIRSVSHASDGGDNLELRLETAILADGRPAFAVAARACRVVWTTSQGATWVQKVRGVTVSPKDASVVTLRLKARHALNVEVVERDHELGLRQNPLPVPTCGDILVTSEDGTVTTGSSRLGLIRVS